MAYRYMYNGYDDRGEQLYHILDGVTSLGVVHSEDLAKFIVQQLTERQRRSEAAAQEDRD